MGEYEGEKSKYAKQDKITARRTEEKCVCERRQGEEMGEEDTAAGRQILMVKRKTPSREQMETWRAKTGSQREARTKLC